MLQNPVVIWFIVGLALILAEFAIPGIVLVFFGAAAWIVSLTTYIGLTGNLTSQLLLFSITTIVLLVGLRKWVKKKLFVGHISDIQDLDTNLDEFTGRSVTVLNDLEPGKTGKVEFKGADWNAVSDVNISRGESAVIKGMDGLTLKVTKQ